MTISEYIAAQPEDIRYVLIQVRETIKMQFLTQRNDSRGRCRHTEKA